MLGRGGSVVVVVDDVVAAEQGCYCIEHQIVLIFLVVV
jgi:hypothetical protein